LQYSHGPGDQRKSRMRGRAILILTIGFCLAASIAGAADDDTGISADLAGMLRAGRAVVSANQERINDPAKGQEGLDGPGFLAQVVAQFQKTTGKDPRAIDPASQGGRLVHMEMDAIVEVIDASQPMFKAPGPTFKGFIPAVFARLVSESFNRRAGGEAQMKVTAPPDLVRNRKAMPDAWELDAITAHFESPGWPKGQAYSAVIDQPTGHAVFRVAVPEYYVASCLSCHGGPKGTMDMTGYPMEGAALGDLGGVISIKLAH
jgi:hypothetical protein